MKWKCNKKKRVRAKQGLQCWGRARFMGFREECEVSNSSLVFCPQPIIPISEAGWKAYISKQAGLVAAPWPLIFRVKALVTLNKGENKTEAYQKTSSVADVELDGIQVDLDACVCWRRSVLLHSPHIHAGSGWNVLWCKLIVKISPGLKCCLASSLL